MLRRAAPLSALLAVGLSGVRGARASDYYKVPGKMEYALDFVKQLKVEVMGASDEFEKLNDGEKSKLLEQISPFGAQKAYVALGCYWGAEATFRCTKGVVGTRVGFMGGKEPDPYYENIKDHIEAIEVTYTGGDETYRRILRMCGRTFDFEDIGPRYARRIWASSPEQKNLATLKGEIWSNMPVRDAANTFFTPAKMDHQAYSKPKCAALAAPNVALVEAGLKRKVDHLHYASDCPTCTLRGEAVSLDDDDFVSDPSTLSPPPRAPTPAASTAV